MSFRTWNLAGVQENLAHHQCCIGSLTTEISSWTPPSRNHPEPTPKPCILVITQRHVTLWSSDPSVSTLFLSRQVCLSGLSIWPQLRFHIQNVAARLTTKPISSAPVAPQHLPEGTKETIS